MKPVPFSWVVWGIVLVIIALLGSFSNVNHDNVDGFFQSVVYGMQHGDVLLIFSALLSFALVVWLLAAVFTGGLEKKPPVGGGPEDRAYSAAFLLLLGLDPQLTYLLSIGVIGLVLVLLVLHLARRKPRLPDAEQYEHYPEREW